MNRLNNIRLIFFGNYSELLKKNISALYPVEFDFKTNYNELIMALRECDLLYLPLNFNPSPSMPRECLQYVLPTKSIDFLITGKKILVHCPEDYELSRFFKKWECGFVLNSIGEGYLGQYLADIVDNKKKYDNKNIDITLNQFKKNHVRSIFINQLENENK